MSYDYSENVLVQESAGHLLADELGWQVELAYNQEILGKNGTFGRSSYKDILLVRYFQKALRTLNPWITDAQVIEAQNTFEKHLSSASLMQINEEKYAYIRDGIPVTEKKPNGQTEEKRAMIIDFQHPDDMERNHFLAVKEMKIHGDLYRRRTDIVGFVNGIPLLFVELKKNSVDVQNAYTDNYTDYLDTIPQLFYYNAFLMLSNGVEAKVGTLGSKYEFFHEWKRLSEQEQGSVALETMLRGICKKENFLDLLENFILFDHSGGKTVKILARNHQYLGVNEAVRAYEARKLNNGKLGVFWHTQGSGKSYSMVFLSQKIRRKFTGSPTIVVLTDREELNSQISDTFENCGLLGKTKASKFIATSGEDLINKLKGNPSFIFTLIQKFNKKVDEPIITDHDIIIMSDEAHRSQYGVFADNMVELLPTASRIGFTGTPLLSNDTKTFSSSPSPNYSHKTRNIQTLSLLSHSPIPTHNIPLFLSTQIKPQHLHKLPTHNIPIIIFTSPSPSYILIIPQITPYHPKSKHHPPLQTYIFPQKINPQPINIPLLLHINTSIHLTLYSTYTPKSPSTIPSPLTPSHTPPPQPTSPPPSYPSQSLPPSINPSIPRIIP